MARPSFECSGHASPMVQLRRARTRSRDHRHAFNARRPDFHGFLGPEADIQVMGPSCICIFGFDLHWIDSSGLSLCSRWNRGDNTGLANMAFVRVYRSLAAEKGV